MKGLKTSLFIIIEIVFSPLTVVSALWSKLLATVGFHRAVLAELIFTRLGVLPINDHYYQPLINPKKHLRYPLSKDRNLPGISFNDHQQLSILDNFDFNDELLKIPLEAPKGEMTFYYNNHSFCSGDAEYLYNTVRFYKPNKIIEIGSGYSTLMIINALKKNRSENANQTIEHICIEPFEQPWLEKMPAKIIRDKVENLSVEIFQSLRENDILFIDSSHMIRPQGDVLFEYLEILPILSPGVLVHIHDIFTPKDYLDEWVLKDHKLWNEQYLLEAFLSLNDHFEVLGALNYLSHKYHRQFANKSPVYAKHPGREPGSIWLRKIR